jgi:hypothetical protein
MFWRGAQRDRARIKRVSSTSLIGGAGAGAGHLLPLEALCHTSATGQQIQDPLIF